MNLPALPFASYARLTLKALSLGCLIGYFIFIIVTGILFVRTSNYAPQAVNGSSPLSGASAQTGFQMSGEYLYPPSNFLFAMPQDGSSCIGYINGNLVYLTGTVPLASARERGIFANVITALGYQKYC